MSLLKHYISKKLNPVPIKFKTKKDLLDHFQKEKNLVQNHLKIPELTIANSEYLEFDVTAEKMRVILPKMVLMFILLSQKSIHEINLQKF